ncbi:MAG: hypothetical protein JKY95_00055, partial [Planctomycetaceae bacterium]|nr:hypothetical protein [Planctomycetaceae bacterium]
MNIPLPNRGVRPSTKKHNCDYQILADWVEASVLFSGYRFSKTEVADVLIEQGVYSDQDFAADFTDRLWTKFRRRSQLVGKSYPFQIDDSGIKIVNTWKKDIVYSFLLYLGIVPWLKDLIPGLKPANYNDQGLLFERLAERAFVYHGWHVTRTGWSSVSDGTIESLVDNVAEHLHDEALPDQIEKWFSQWGNDEGLDLVCTREFQDERGGCAAILIQVASGD